MARNSSDSNADEKSSYHGRHEWSSQRKRSNEKDRDDGELVSMTREIEGGRREKELRKASRESSDEEGELVERERGERDRERNGECDDRVKEYNRSSDGMVTAERKEIDEKEKQSVGMRMGIEGEKLRIEVGTGSDARVGGIQMTLMIAGRTGNQNKKGKQVMLTGIGGIGTEIMRSMEYIRNRMKGVKIVEKMRVVERQLKSLNLEEQPWMKEIPMQKHRIWVGVGEFTSHLLVGPNDERDSR